MNRNWIIYLWTLVMGCCMAACQQENMPSVVDDNLTLQIRICPTEDGSRAESAGDDNLNENKLNKVDCFF